MQILYVDNHLLVVYKPAGLPVQADASGDIDLLTMAKHWIKREYAKPGEVFVGLVHRLDRPARGVVVLARTSKAAARLSEQFRNRTTVKRYEVVVLGQPEPPAAELRDQLQSDERGSRVVASGQPASLDYRTLDRRGDRSWLEVDLHSGRKHQIRVQLASRGWPVLGDLRYGAKEPLADQSIALLARRLEIDHPTRAERLSFAAPDPPGWPWQPNESRDFL
ncbi:MAG: RNA pseudouridine synthase [Deltaproteobacteria bacterium]|nr:RNA pseudouridine synthase [Deltaproteobacteria bacterium]